MQALFNNSVAFLFGWMMFFAYAAGATAVTATLGAEYAARFLPAGAGWGALATKAITVAFIGIFTVVNCVGVRESGRGVQHDERNTAGVGAVSGFLVGEFTMKLLALPALASRRLAVLIDGNPARHGLRFGDVRVGPPTQLANANTPIVIGSLLSGQSIRRDIEASGWPNPVIGPATVRRLA